MTRPQCNRWSPFGYKPDQSKPVTEMQGAPVDQIYIGFMHQRPPGRPRIAATILKGKKLADGVRGFSPPATPKVFRDANQEGLIEIFMQAVSVSPTRPAAPVLGMSNGVLAEGEVCASTTNRNFMGRMGKGGMVHLMSPATAAACAIEGKLADPRKYL